MKNKLLLFFILLSYSVLAQQQNVNYTISPNVFEENETITITIEGNSINEATWNITNNALYLWAWSFDLNLDNIQNCPTNGDWTNSNETNKLTYNSGNDTYTISFVPSTFYNRTSIGRIGFLIKAKDGTGDKKSQDILADVGAFQVIQNAPESNSTTILNSGDNLTIDAQNTGGNANYTLRANGMVINTQTNISTYNYTDTNITENKNYELEVNQNGNIVINTFQTIVDPGNNIAVMPTDYQDGITYLSDTEAVLVLYATGKDFVYVAGSFNNWQPDSSYAMKKDPTRNNKFWLELTGLTANQIETYQYWVVDKTPAVNSPTLVKTADPYSTLVLSPFDDPYIPANTYPNLPAYPAGQEREVTVLQTGQTPYAWQVTNFQKPKKEDLVIYEVLIRDFDADRNFQDLIDKIDYFKNLNINAIQLMPVMEFEGNESWGYNTSFHMALDKYYGTEDKFKELVDVFHQNGIAVVLDVALNHAFGRNPMVRMWMNDPDNDGWGEPSSENPYFNEVALHSYNVGSDFDHSNPRTQDYVKRVIEHWINNFNIDGFRWDLTKGFTQQCTASDEACTNAYQSDRVAVLKSYADHSWAQDDTHYVIFEHLGGNQEEKEWADYRVNENKGIMLWGKMTNNYNQLTMGYNSDNDISGVGHESRNFNEPRLVGYAESHDEERLMYKNLQFGNQSNTAHDVQDLNTALSRMSALGAVTLTIPGPKMIWHFGALGMENSIFTCNNGTVNEPGDADGSGDCKLDTKPQPQWTNNWLADANRNKIYNDWARINILKTEEAVFEGDYSINQTDNSLTPKIYIWDDTLPTTELKNVVILANFDVSNQNITPNFPYTGIWYDLMDPTGNTTINVTNVNTPIPVDAGQFKMYGNQNSQTLSTIDYNLNNELTLYPNPANNTFAISKKATVIEIYNISGKLIKRFKGDFIENTSFSISDITQGIYIVKTQNNLGATSTTKLIKL
ncbi:alpha-amylase family glycosyl hydrolase [Lacinutrix sp. 5H-3-7-4]|uniref:alpha-amylase family glycosyl hydrolase n=1 Tax=Lacinutrix sp. (strain 5H-3-7-4) TaxID=983544 RepID=UPI00020A3BCB|nr:alpha-amylase family glycosyl hydrolase [Lacinutrix sp. 5H-3-7-4]AEH00528.1 alpha amylase catalytic region [Lacinutrix sp. 5H-3-7-4]